MGGEIRGIIPRRAGNEVRTEAVRGDREEGGGRSNSKIQQ